MKLAWVGIHLLLGAQACGSTRGSGPFTLPNGTPDQLACMADAECVAAPYHFDDAPCCNSDTYTSVQSRRFLAWRDEWQAAECAAVDCEAVNVAHTNPNTPPATPPPPCYFEPRCTQGRCGGSCGP